MNLGYFMQRSEGMQSRSSLLYHSGVIALAIFLLNTASISAQVLRQMVVEDVPEGEYPTYLVRNPDEAVLIVHSLIDNLSFETNNGSIKQDHPSPGEYVLHLRPGTHIMRFKAEGYSVVQKRLVIDKKSYREVRIQPAGRLGERAEFGTVEFTLEPGPVIVIQNNVQSGEFAVDASGVFRLQLSPGKHRIKLVRLGSGNYETEFDLSVGEIYREEATFSGTATTVTTQTTGSGVLLVKSNPTDATVFVDGVMAGNTTLQVREISSGVHQIRIEKILYQPVVKQVEIAINSLTTLEEELAPDYATVSISSMPLAAEVTFDGKLVGKTAYHNEAVSSGQHSVLLRKSYFHDKVLDMNIVAGVDVDTLINLLPAFGSLRVISKPDGASVYLDNSNVGATPLTLDTLSSGQYMLRVQNDRYGSLERTITISDGKRTLIDTPLDEDFGTLVVNSQPQGISVRVDGVEAVEGTTPLRRNLKPGLYTITLADDKYESYSESVNLHLKDYVEINVDSLVRKTGALKVFTNPIEAQLYVDDKSVGKSPLVATYPTGRYEIRAELDGYVPASKTVVVTHKTTTDVDLALLTGGSIEIEVQPLHAALYLDGRKISLRNVSSLSEGKHNIEARAHGYQTYRTTISIRTGIKELVNIKLNPIGGTVLVVPSSRRSSLPSSTTLAIDGLAIDGIQASNVSPGSHLVSVTAQGYQAFEKRVEVKSGELVKVKFKAKKVRPPNYIPPKPRVIFSAGAGVLLPSSEPLQTFFGATSFTRFGVGIRPIHSLEIGLYYSQATFKPNGIFSGPNIKLAEFLVDVKLIAESRKSSGFGAYLKSSLGYSTFTFSDLNESKPSIVIGGGSWYMFTRVLGIYAEGTYSIVLKSDIMGDATKLVPIHAGLRVGF